MSNKTRVTYKKNKKLDKIYHPDSGLVIKSAKERIVIGRIDDGEFVPLDDVALELCEEWDLEPDKTLLEDEEDEDVDEKTKKKSKDEDEDDEEEEKPKGKKSKPKDEDEEEEEKPKGKKKSKPKDEDEEEEEKPKGKKSKPAEGETIVELLARHAKEVQDYVAGLTTSSSDNDLEKELEKTKKELEKTKKKLKNVLASMQDAL
uniref:Uncharacterized protein n=1 Tax=viral metagenome TaxID=1070528 RepID=A0A6C0EJW1_9ZZZZ